MKDFFSFYITNSCKQYDLSHINHSVATRIEACYNIYYFSIVTNKRSAL